MPDGWEVKNPNFSVLLKFAVRFLSKHLAINMRLSSVTLSAKGQGSKGYRDEQRRTEGVLLGHELPEDSAIYVDHGHHGSAENGLGRRSPCRENTKLLQASADGRGKGAYRGELNVVGEAGSADPNLARAWVGGG